MPRVVLLTGSNLGDKSRLLEDARSHINRRIGPVVQASRIYESEPWGFSAEETFLNQVLVIETPLSPVAVLDEAQAVEKELGRVRMNPVPEERKVYESRPIDIDILFYDDLVLDSDRLVIPHPLIAEREFVLIPLCEIMAGYIHPVHLKTIRELRDKYWVASGKGGLKKK